MPHTITTKQRVDAPDLYRPEGVPERVTYAPVYRRAVATLEADEVALRLFGVAPGKHDTLTDEQAHIVSSIARLPESGGTLGPFLPDGWVIEVEATEWDALDPNLGHLAASPFPNFYARERILDAFNAKENAGK